MSVSGAGAGAGVAPPELPITTIQLSFSAKKLADLDTFSKSDPAVWVFLSSNGTETLVGKTGKHLNLFQITLILEKTM